MPKKDTLPEVNNNETITEAIDAVVDVAIEASDVQLQPEKQVKQISELDKVLRGKRPKTFVEDGSDLFTQDVQTKYDSEQALSMDATMQALTAAAQNKTYITSTVANIRKDPELGPCALCYYRYDKDSPTYQVLIPYKEFTDVTDEELEKIHLTKEIFLSRRADTTIDFIPVDYREDPDTGKYTFIASRNLAMGLSRYYHWYGFNKDGNKRTLKFNPGSLVEARVVGVYPRAGIRIEFCGAETLVPVRELSWLTVDNTLSDFDIHVGDVIKVRLTEVKRRPDDDYAVDFEASIKRVGADPRIDAFEMLEIGDRIKGTVTRIIKDPNDLKRSRLVIRLDNNGEATCTKFTMPVKKGDVVRCLVGEKKILPDGTPRIKVLITRVEYVSK